MHISTPRSNVGISSILKHEYRMQGSDKQFLMFQKIYIATWYF